MIHPYTTDGNRRLLEVNYIYTIAGTGSYSGDGGLATSATLNGPYGVAIDPTTGDVFIADSNNHRIRLIYKSSGNNYIYITIKLGVII
jgi:DNA-binding beta-propeller fold protein YncE